MSDPYSVLGVAKTASDDDIRKAFRKLAKKHHPDLNPGDKAAEAKFKEISQANDILSDPEKRRRFDAGEIDATGQEMPPRGFYRDQAGGMGGGKYERAGAPRILRRHGRHLLRDVRPKRRARRRLQLPRRRRRGLRHGRPARDLQPARAVPGGRARRQAARHPARRQDARHRCPRGHDRRPDPAPERPGHARHQGPAGGRRLCRDPRRSARLLRAARQRHPCRVAGDADRGRAGRPHPRADRGRAGHAGRAGGLEHGHIAAPQGPRPARPQVGPARRPVRQAQGRDARPARPR